MLLRIALAGSLTLTSACAFTPVAGPQSGLNLEAGQQRTPVARGDRLRILTLDGRRRTITVVDANPQAIVTRDETIPISQLVFVERRRVDGGRSAVAAGAVLVVLVIATGGIPFAFIPNTAPPP